MISNQINNKVDSIQVILDKRIPFNLLQVSEGENVIFCKKFTEQLFDTGLFSTKEKDFVHNYILENGEKYIITDVNTNNGQTHKNVKFKIVVLEKGEVPFSTFNPKGTSTILEKIVLPENKITEDLNILEKNKSNDFDKKRLEQIEERLENKKNRLINEEKHLLNKKLILKEEKEKSIQEQKEKENDLQKKYKIIREAKDDIIASSRQYLEEKLKASSEENKNYARRILDLGGGGGSVAVQYANGGTMNGDLNVNGHILSGGKDISNYFGGSGGGSQTLSFNENNADLSISGGNTVSLSALSGGVSGPTDRLISGSYQAILSSNGDLTFPTGSKISRGYPGLTQDDSSWFVAPTGQTGGLASADGEQYIQLGDNSPIYIGTGWPDSYHEWIFGTDGKLTVPGAIGTTSNSKLDLVGFGPNTAYLTSTSDDTTALYLAAAVAELRANTTVSIYTNTGDTSLQWTFGADGTTSFPNAAIDGGTAPIELKSRSWSQLTYNNNDMTPEPNKNHSTTFFVEGGDALLEIFRWDNNSVLQHRQWTFSSDGGLTLPTVLSGDTSIGTEFNTNPPGHTLTLKHNGGVGSGSGGELKFDYGTAEIKIVQDAGATQTWTFGTDGGLTFPDNTTQTTAFTGNPDLTPYAKITDFVHLSGDIMTGDLYTPTLSAGNIYSENSINAVGQFSFQNGDFISSTDGTGNFVDLRNANYYQLNFVNTSDNGAGDWHVGNYIPWGSFSWYSTALGRSMLDLIDGTQDGHNLGVYFYDNVSINAGAPLAKLHVKGSSNDVNTPIAIIESDGSQVPYTFRVGGVDRAYVKGDSDGNLAFGAQNFIAFEAGWEEGAAEAMRITVDKNVGIGTDIPSEKLEVVGNLKVTNNITAYDIAAQNQVQYLSSGVVKVYQFYNSSTNSLDTIFA